jgi:hypothetical protein
MQFRSIIAASTLIGAISASPMAHAVLHGKLPISPTLNSGEWATPDGKSCAEAPSAMGVPPNVKNFCLGFAADYFYRLHSTSETLVYNKGQKQSQEYIRPAFSTEGALFLLGQAQIESGWADGDARERHNFWGFHGSKTKIAEFESIESGFAFYFNHMQRGINGSGADWAAHPGWPAFLELLTQENVSTSDLNRTLNSGPWCHTFPAYNVGTEPGCKNGNTCPCVDYAGIIREKAVANVVSNCLKIYDSFPDAVVKSDIYPKERSRNGEPLPPQTERRRIAREEMAKYAKSRCGIPSLYSEKNNPTSIKEYTAFVASVPALLTQAQATGTSRDADSKCDQPQRAKSEN